MDLVPLSLLLEKLDVRFISFTGDDVAPFLPSTPVPTGEEPSLSLVVLVAAGIFVPLNTVQKPNLDSDLAQ